MMIACFAGSTDNVRLNGLASVSNVKDKACYWVLGVYQRYLLFLLLLTIIIC